MCGGVDSRGSKVSWEGLVPFWGSGSELNVPAGVTAGGGATVVERPFLERFARFYEVNRAPPGFHDVVVVEVGIRVVGVL